MANFKDIKGRNVDIGSTIQFVSRYGREINSTMTGRNAKVLGLSSKGRVQLSFCDSSSTISVNPDRIADCAVVVQTTAPPELPSSKTIETKKPIKSKKAKIIDWVIKTIDGIDTLPIDSDAKEQLSNKILEAVGDIERAKTRKYTPGIQEKLLSSLRKLGGTATRDELTSDSGLDPNAVSSLLSKLGKRGHIQKVPLENPVSTSGRGLTPMYAYRLQDEQNGKVETLSVESLLESEIGELEQLKQRENKLFDE